MQLNQVTVPVKDVPASIKFYEKLGMCLIVHTDDHYARFECPGEGSVSTFSIHKVEKLPQGDGIWVYFEVSDVDAVISRLVADGLHIDEQPEDKAWLWCEARLKDPDGNQLIIYHAGKNRRNPPWQKENA